MGGGDLLIYEGTEGGCCGDVHVGDVYRIWDDVGMHNEACTMQDLPSLETIVQRISQMEVCVLVEVRKSTLYVRTLYM